MRSGPLNRFSKSSKTTLPIGLLPFLNQDKKKLTEVLKKTIDFKDIKFTKQVYEELNGIENANITERKILLEKLVDKFGLYVPLELLIGGRINMSFDANNEDEKKQDFSK